MTKNSLSLLILLAFLVLLSAPFASALGPSNNCIAIIKKRRGELKKFEEEEIQLASMRKTNGRITEDMDVSATTAQSSSEGTRRRAPPATKSVGWALPADS